MLKEKTMNNNVGITMTGTSLINKIIIVLFFTSLAASQPIIIDHNHRDITKLPEAAILNTKSTLHIAYGHLSHGFQIPYR